MRRLTHDTPVYFRCAAHVVAQAEERARQQGMNLSELMRHALRRELQGGAR